MRVFYYYRALMAFILIGSAVCLSAQTKEDVINTYNAGVALASTDVKAAIEKFNLAREMAIKVGTEADTLKNMIETQLPRLQINYAADLYKAKNIAEAIPNYLLAIELAEKVGNTEIAAKAKEIIPKLYFSQGNDLYKSEKYDSALMYFDRALSYDSTYAKAYLTKGLVYKKQDNTEAMIAAMDKAIHFAKASNDEKTATTAGNVVRDNLLVNGNKAVKAGNFQQAIPLLNQAKTYGEPKSDIFYLLALSYNKGSQWDAAIEAANQGIELEKESTVEARAKFYYELGNGYLGKGENTSACTSYKNALYGNYLESAKYQIETVLKCN
ncbi:MAG TPA: tetratricopeptide repeat protein [Bacteroidales bacterium]|nr:tetratricopeptide repeat protein [Bacteroidales bacterium]HRZ21044.1 tetratricopeptide repeat protein [Bacteroidales bacterium]